MTKDMKWLQTKLDRATTKDVEKEDKIVSYLDRFEKYKDSELDLRRQI